MSEGFRHFNYDMTDREQGRKFKRLYSSGGICEYGWTTQDELRHRISDKVPQHVCRHCPKSFHRLCDLNKHEKPRNNPPWKCPYRSYRHTRERQELSGRLRCLLGPVQLVEETLEPGWQSEGISFP